MSQINIKTEGVKGEALSRGCRIVSFNRLKFFVKAYPRKCKFVVLEDNDPSGFKTKMAEVAKKEAGIKPFVIPRRSPQLNVLDYSEWSVINTRMRDQEKRWPASKKETRDEYLVRLRRTALRLPLSLINTSVMNLKER